MNSTNDLSLFDQLKILTYTICISIHSINFYNIIRNLEPNNNLNNTIVYYFSVVFLLLIEKLIINHMKESVKHK